MRRESLVTKGSSRVLEGRGFLRMVEDGSRVNAEPKARMAAEPISYFSRVCWFVECGATERAAPKKQHTSGREEQHFFSCFSAASPRVRSLQHKAYTRLVCILGRACVALESVALEQCARVKALRAHQLGRPLSQG